MSLLQTLVSQPVPLREDDDGVLRNTCPNHRPARYL